MLWIPTQRTVILLSAALCVISIFAKPATLQTPSALPQQTNPTTNPLLQFEVATIKPAGPQDSNSGTDIDPGGVVKLDKLTLKTMIEVAFNVSYWQIDGGEPWMAKTEYNVVGKPPDSIRQTLPDTRHTWYTIADPRLREMLQTLLIERFHLKIHRSTQTGKVFFLERSTKPLTLVLNKTTPADPSSPQSTFGSIGWAERWVLSDVTMAELANFAERNILHRPVLDHTGLSGAFDYRSPPDPPGTPIIDQENSFMDMLKQVGLKLEPTNGQAEILTIDHADPPSPN